MKTLKLVSTDPKGFDKKDIPGKFGLKGGAGTAIVLALALCLLPYNLLAWEAGEPFNKSALIEMDEYRQEQDQSIGQLNFFGVLTEEEQEDVKDISKPELGHFFGSHVAAAENDEDRYYYHIEKREELMDEMEVLLDAIKERLEETRPPEPEAPKQNL